MLQTRPTSPGPRPDHDPDQRRTRRTGTAAGRALLAVAVLVAATAAWVASAPPASAALGGHEIVVVTTASSSTAVKSITAVCPGTKRVIGGGGTVVGTGGGPAQVRLTRLEPSDTASGTSDGYLVTAAEISSGTAASWAVRAYAVCVNSSAVGRWRIARATSTTSSDAAQFVAAPCGSGDDVFGTGAAIGMAPVAEVGLQVARSDDVGSLARAQAHEDVDGYSGLWNVTAFAICGAALDGYQIVTERSVAEGSEDTKTASVSCPAGKVTVSAGGAVDGAAPGHVTLATVAPDRLGGTVIARENLPLAASWDFIIVRLVCANP